MKKEIRKNKKILVWGTGNVAKKVLGNGIKGEIVGFIESEKEKPIYMGRKVYSPDEIPDNFDYIIVASSYVADIYRACIKLNINLDKVIFLSVVKEQKGFTNMDEIKSILGTQNLTDFCHEFGLWNESFFVDDIKRYSELNVRESFKIEERYLWPILNDKYAMAGSINNYFWQDLWAAKRIYKSKVKTHFDIGSRVDGFIAHLLAMDIDVSVIDVRKFPGEVENLHTIVDDATKLKQIEDDTIYSMSALCSLEHFGLGRYGDKIDPEACFRCFEEIQKKMAKQGNLYISVPIGKERLEFNAHRVFYANTIIESFHDMVLKEFSCTAGGRIEYDVDIHKYDNDMHDGNYRYGLFHFQK